MAKDWKDILLSSGLPLEHSVVRMFEDRLRLTAPSEYSFERLNEFGQTKIFSVDLRSELYFEGTDTLIDLFMECKYRHDSVRWLFAPTKLTLSQNPALDIFPIFDQLGNEDRINRKDFAEFLALFPACDRATELLTNNASGNGIAEAVSQLRFAAGLALSWNLGNAIAFRTTRLIIPIIVTTAELWRLTPNATIKSIREASELNDVATKHDMLLLMKPTDQELTRVVIQDFSSFKNRGPEFLALLKSTLEIKNITDEEQYFSRIARKHPSAFLVVRFDVLDSFIEQLSRFFESENSLIRKSQNGRKL